tara:strand:+ start:500 stop:1045 length:546 start_codon:yes stop_codon:yes gene_type:complete
MATGNVALSTTEYVRINTGLNGVMLQAHRDSVRIVFSDAQPNISNQAFHLLGADDETLQVPVIEVNVWALAMTNTSSLTITETVAGVAVKSKQAPVAGTWGYSSGADGTLTLTGGKRVLQITAVSLEVAGDITINGGDMIRLPYGNVDKVSTEITIHPQGNLTDPTIVFTGTDSYFVEYVS